MVRFSNVKNYASFLKGLSPNEITILGSILGIVLSQNLTANEAQSLGNMLELVGQALLTYGAQKQLLDELDD